ncbi:MAG: hypothetical protein ABIV51_11905, partial [Saprospiraceae bacterium]
MNRHQIKSRTKKFCQITKMHLDSTEVIHVQLIKESIVENLKQDFPEMDSSGFVSVLALNRYYFKKIKPAVADAGHADPHDISSISIESEMIYTETEDFG